MLCRLAVLVLLCVAVAAAETGGGGLKFSHEAFDTVLKSWVKDGVVDYEGIKTEGRALFDSYLQQLATASLDGMNEREKLAFWINAYNACAIEGVLQGESTRNAMARARFFKFRKFKVAGQNVTLHHMEHDIIRKLFNDSRVHFALVCTSKGCPPLQSGAFGRDSLESALEQGGRLFVRDPSKVRIDEARRVVYVSPIFRWYENDFARQGLTVEDVLKKYLPREQAAILSSGPPFRIEFLEYDWSVNSRK